MATGLFSGTLRAYPDPSFPGCNSTFMQPVYFSKSVLVFLLAAATVLPHFSLSAETYPLTPVFMSGRLPVPCQYVCYIFFPVPFVLVASQASPTTSHRLWFHIFLVYHSGTHFTFYCFILYPFSPTAPRFRCNTAGRTNFPAGKNRSLFCLMYKKF